MLWGVATLGDGRPMLQLGCQDFFLVPAVLFFYFPMSLSYFILDFLVCNCLSSSFPIAILYGTMVLVLAKSLPIKNYAIIICVTLLII